MNAACVAPQELNRLLDERPLPEGQYAAWRDELKEQEAQFPLAFPLRDDVIVPQWAIKVRPPPAPLRPASCCQFPLCRSPPPPWRLCDGVMQQGAVTCMRRVQRAVRTREVWPALRCMVVLAALGCAAGRWPQRDRAGARR